MLSHEVDAAKISGFTSKKNFLKKRRIKENPDSQESTRAKTGDAGLISLVVIYDCLAGTYVNILSRDFNDISTYPISHVCSPNNILVRTGTINKYGSLTSD